MEVTYRSGNGQFEVVFDVKSQVELFEEIGNFQEVFETGDVTIKGKKVPASDIQFRVREVEGNKYFEKVYTGSDKDLWGFKLPYGQNKKGGGLFPRWKLDQEDKNNYEDGGGGWRKWRGSAAPAKSEGSEERPF